MIFDDHDVNDDWNTSRRGSRRSAHRWWDRPHRGRVHGLRALPALGNLPPDALAEDPLFQRVRDAATAARSCATGLSRGPRGLGRRAGATAAKSAGAARDDRLAGRRVLEPGGRSVVDEEWRWITEHATGGYDHLLIGTSLPLIMAPGLHYLEAWNEAVSTAPGAAWLARGGEDPPGARPRVLAGVPRLVHRHVRARCARSGRAGAGRAGCDRRRLRRRAPRLSRRGRLPGRQRRQPRVWQATCSPFRNPLSTKRGGGQLHLQRHRQGDRPRNWRALAGVRAAGALDVFWGATIRGSTTRSGGSTWRARAHSCCSRPLPDGGREGVPSCM